MFRILPCRMVERGGGCLRLCARGCSCVLAGEQGDVRPYAKFLVDAVKSNKDAKDSDELVKVRCVRDPCS